MHIAAAIKAIIDGNDLSEKQCYDAIYEVMSGEATDAQIAGLLIALRVKGETVEEITGGARALAERANRIAPKVPICVDPVGTGGDGTNTFNISSTAAIVAAAGGACVAKHGNRCISSRSGSADFYEAIGINIALAPAAVERCIEEVGFGFMFAPNFHPAMRFAGPVRRQLAVRNIFNILGPLSNPAGAKAQVLGVYDQKIMDYIAKTLQRLGESHSLVVHGSDGSDEITNTGETYICEVYPDRIEEYTITPEQFGMKRVTLDDIRGGTPEENTEISMNVFRGQKGPHRDIVVLNSAATLYVAGLAPTLPDAVRLAEETIDSGKALRKLDQIRTFTNRDDIIDM
ncbi:MAG: anthranilate phosphoribosyltransferase [Clostridiales bacterium]|nr:anthranilate phosphoribosyltransferase [Clostridiales bacterium]